MFEKKKKNAVVQFYPWLKFYFPFSLSLKQRKLNLNEGLTNAPQHTNADEA